MTRKLIYTQVSNSRRWILSVFFVFAASLLLCYNASAQTTALFTASDSTGCLPFSVQFTNNSINANSFYWSFGNGTTSSLQNPSVLYVTQGNFTVFLIATNSFTGTSDTLIASNLITVVSDPAASFTATPLSACVNTNTISFTNTSVNANSYTWDFGDGNGSTQTNPIHTYSNPGTYTIKLIAANTTGCNDLAVATNYITIYPKPSATFTSNFNSTCDSNDVFIFNSTDPSIISWNWDFGDGTTSNQSNPSHVYGNSGSFNVSLICSNTNGCYDTVSINNYVNIGSSLVPSFTTSSQSGCSPITVQFNSTVPNGTSWLWNFGDGTTSNLPNPSHTYNSAGSYTIGLAVNTINNCNGTVSIPNYITVSDDPVSNFNLSNNSGCAPHDVTFTNNSTGATSYLWNFGDGVTSTLQTPTHTYAAAGIYTVTLISYNALGCSDTLQLANAITVEDITTDFTATPRIGCSVLPVNFTANIAGTAVSWQWNFGNGNTANTANPSNNYFAINDYNVTLIATTALGCTDTITKTNFISVVPDTTAYTVPDTINGCAPEPLSFFDPTIGSNSWSWTFGDGDTSAVKNPVHVYYYPGIYTVTLNTGMAGGCTQSFVPYAIVKIDSFVVDDNQIIQLTNCPPFQFSFNNPTLFATGYAWDFGDGTTSNIQNPLHSYQNSGTYIVSLSLTMVNGCVFTVNDTITVGYPNPIVAGTINFCLGDTSYFSISNTAAFVSATWQFGDSTSAIGLNVSHIYDTVGNYTITVDLIDTIGCLYNYVLGPLITVRDPIPDFAITPEDTACDILTANFINLSTNALNYTWGFGDGTTSNAINPIYTYTSPGTYTVTLIARNTGCIRSKTVTNAIVVNEAQANFTFVPSSYCLPSAVLFNDSSINAVTWQWYFGDGTTASGPIQNHIYTSPPQLPASLTIVDINGCTDSISKSLSFANTSFICSDTAGCAPLTCVFSSNAATALSYFWDFGDGNTSALAQPAHTYANDGLYSVMLVVTYPQGCSDTVRYNNYININTAIASFSSPTVSLCAPSEVFFTNTSSNATSYLWDFGDGVTSTVFEPSHIYNIPGYYTVTLIAYSAYGCSDTVQLIDYIEIPGSFALFSYTPQVGCESFSAQFNDQSINATNWSWNFGDGSTSSLQNPVHVYNDTGTYVVSLVVSDTGNCTSFISINVQVTFDNYPTASGFANSPGGCLPYSISFTNTSSANATSAFWYFGDGDTSSVINPTHQYNYAGIYYPKLVAITSAGCADTFQFSIPIEILQTPDAQFSASLTSGCYGSTINFLNQSTGIQTPSYFWQFSNGSTSAQANPALTLYQAGFYSVSLMVTNANGCADSILKQNLIFIADTIAPAADPVLTATVVSNKKIAVTWQNSPDTDLKVYELYRKNLQNGQYVKIFTDLNPVNSTIAFSSTYIDSTVNTLVNEYSYRLRTVDECDQAVNLNNLIAYTTIELSSQTQAQNVILNWNAYMGCEVGSYNIERTELPSGTSQLIASVDSQATQFTDTTLLCPGKYSYRVIATDLCGRNYQSYSDTVIANPAHPIKYQEIEVSRSTVFEDKFVLTEWMPPTIYPQRVIAYIILRGEDNLNFVPVATVGGQVFQYIDQHVNVKESKYYYKVIPLNDCQLTGSAANVGSSILLQGKKPDDYHTILNWSRYEGWTNGVQKYVIEKLDDNNNWQLIKVVDGNTNQIKLDE